MNQSYECNLKEKSNVSIEREKDFQALISKTLKITEKRVQTIKDLPFYILGFNSQRHILLWHKGQIISVPVNQLKPDELKLFVGELPNLKDYAELKKQILDSAFNKGIINEQEPIKSGIWKLKNKWVIVSGRRTATIDNGQFEFLDTPLIDNRTIEFEDRPWIDLDHLKNHLPKANLPSIFKKIEQIVAQWNWRESDMSEFVSAFILLQLFQSLLQWRPWIYLLGAAGTGKSTLLDLLEQLFGPLVKRLDKSTAHATAQTVGSTGKVPIFDEFEKNRHMSEILELLKLCNRGGQKTSGTTGVKANVYSMHHIPWFASIYLPRSFANDQAQLSRIVKFELKKISEIKPLINISSEEASDILCSIVAAVIANWETIEELVKEIQKKKGKYIESTKNKIDGRCVDNLMYAMALISIAKDKECGIPSWAIQDIKNDGENILEVILMSKIRHCSGEEFLVVDLIYKVLGHDSEADINEATSKDLLRKNGLTVVKRKFLAVLCRNVSDSILRFNDDFKGLDIQAPLERLEGAKKNEQTDWGKQVKQRALHIPMIHIHTITNFPVIPVNEIKKEQLISE